MTFFRLDLVIQSVDDDCHQRRNRRAKLRKFDVDSRLTSSYYSHAARVRGVRPFYFNSIWPGAPVRKAIRYLLLVTAVVLGLLGIAVLGLYNAAQRQPKFYRQAMLGEPAEYTEAGDALEQRVFDLHNEVRSIGVWEAEFTEAQVNGWLVADLPDKFPNVLPRGTQEPRVAIDSEAIRVACQFDNGKFKTVISMALDVDLTTETNTLAVRVSKLRAGALPVPLKQFLDKISVAASRGDIPLKWRQIDGDPVALVTVPVTHEDYLHREIYVDTIELREGAIYLAGHTEQRIPPTLSASVQLGVKQAFPSLIGRIERQVETPVEQLAMQFNSEMLL